MLEQTSCFTFLSCFVWLSAIKTAGLLRQDSRYHLWRSRARKLSLSLVVMILFPFSLELVLWASAVLTAASVYRCYEEEEWLGSVCSRRGSISLWQTSTHGSKMVNDNICLSVSWNWQFTSNSFTDKLPLTSSTDDCKNASRHEDDGNAVIYILVGQLCPLGHSLGLKRNEIYCYY